MRSEHGFAIVATALLVAVSIMFGLGVIVVVEHSHMVEGATRAQQLQSIRAAEDLSTSVSGENVKVINKGSLPSVIVTFLINTENGLAVESVKNAYLGAFDNRTFTITTAINENDKVGVLTQLGNVFWAE